MANNNIALVVSGGGSKGAFAVGILMHLFDKYRQDGWFDIIGGSSTGALIAPMVALMAAPEGIKMPAYQTLIRYYTRTSTNEILKKKRLLEILLRFDCLNRSDPLRKLISNSFPQEWFDWLRKDEAPRCYVCYVNFHDGKKYFASPKDANMTREKFIECMMASASVPVLMNSTAINDKVCYDGGIRDLIPFNQAIELGARTIVPIYLDPKKFPESSEKFEQMDKTLMRTLSILIDEILRNDTSLAKYINMAVLAKNEIMNTIADPELKRKMEVIFNSNGYKKLFTKEVIKIFDGLWPDEELTDNSLEFVPEKMREWAMLGVEKAKQVFINSPFK